MFTDLLKHFQILYAPDDGAGGGEGGDGDGGGDSTKSAAAQNNEDIASISRSITDPEEGEGNRKDPMSRHIGYFEEELEEEEGGEPDPDPNPNVDDDDFEEDDFEEEFEEESEQAKAKKKAGKEGDEEIEIDPAKKDFFYVPERDAKDRDPYPNDYETRRDAQFAISEKIDTFDKYMEALEEAGSSIGAAIDPQVKQKIEKYRDLNYANEVDDDTMRADIIDLDEGLKATKLKVDRVQKKAKSQKVQKQAEKEYRKNEKEAKKASQAIGLPDRLNELPEGFEKNDLLELVDEQINEALSEIDNKIQEHEDDTEYLEEHGQKAYVQKLKDLQEERQEKAAELEGHRGTIDAWYESMEKYQKAKDSNTELSDAEKAERIDQAFLEFQEDRSQGPNALDIFTKSKDTKPIVHFRQYALSPANKDKWDLTTPAGWIEAHADWKQWVEENVGKQKAGNAKSKNDKQKKRKRKPIPTPDRGNNMRYMPTGGDHDGLVKTNKEISQLARDIMGN